MMNNNELKIKVNEVKEYCMNRKNCDGCIYHTEIKDCEINMPFMWANSEEQDNA